MLFNVVIISALIATALAFPFQPMEKRQDSPRKDYSQSTLPSCGTDPVTCRCPANSFYQTSSSYAFWPVPASEITNLTVNFLDSSWLGTSPESTSGNGTTVGAKRYLRAPLPESMKAELIVEEMTELTLSPDGGYSMKFQMADMPFWYQKERRGAWGLLAGSWDLIDVREINGWAYMLWDIHVCFMDAYDLSGFHESGMNNITSILKARGVMSQNATMIGPITF